MKKMNVSPKTKLLMAVLAVSIVLVLALCGCSSSPQEPPDNASGSPAYSVSADDVDVPPEEEEKPYYAGKIGITLSDEINENGFLTGTATDLVRMGDFSALMALDFEYEIDGEYYKIVNVLDANVINFRGWTYVARAVTIDTENIKFDSTGTGAAVPVTYSASLGEGMLWFDGVFYIDLSSAFYEAALEETAD